MRLSEFNYELPQERIAQYPSRKRGEDRLLVLDRKKRSLEEKDFVDIVDYFKRGDLLVVNNTKVIPARLYGRRSSGGKVEIFIVDTKTTPVKALVRPSRRIKEGERITLDSGDEATVLGRAETGRFVAFNRPLPEILEKNGHVPLPPYIARPDEPEDKVRYQTVYAANEGASASPTAGLHFTGDMIDKLKEEGVEIAQVTLHVSYATFASVKEETVERHRMYSEFYRIAPGDAVRIHKALRRKATVFSCGTTSLRVLETCAEALLSGEKSGSGGFEGYTDLYIYPGYTFRIVDRLITNFHLPESTLLLLTSAFAGRDLVLNAYKYAIRNNFMFYSYGDAMLIL